MKQLRDEAIVKVLYGYTNDKHPVVGLTKCQLIECRNIARAVQRERDKEWSSPIPGIGGSMLVAKEQSGLHTSDEAYKMAITDALSVAMKMLGVAADIYAGLWDGAEYKTNEATKKQTTKTEPKATEKKRLEYPQVLLDEIVTETRKLEDGISRVKKWNMAKFGAVSVKDLKEEEALELLELIKRDGKE